MLREIKGKCFWYCLDWTWLHSWISCTTCLVWAWNS